MSNISPTTSRPYWHTYHKPGGSWYVLSGTGQFLATN